ncbi:MAG: C39 family peptidase [Candidatus Shapirobacteria bacterium]|jgi:hypothetical protein
MTLKKITIGLFILILSCISWLIFENPTRFEQKFSNTATIVENTIDTIAPKPTKILKDGLPNRYLIEAPFVEQAPEKNWDQPWQDACEEAGLLTVDYFYKNITPSPQDIKQSILDMIDYEKLQKWKIDININQMQQISEKYLGYNSEILINPSVEEIKKYISKNIPIVVPANGKTLYRENKHFKNGGPEYHVVVILGYNDDKSQFTVHDVGTQFGKYFRYSYNLLLEANHNLPESGNKKEIDSGSKEMLILLK